MFSFLNYFSVSVLILVIGCKCSNAVNYYTKIYSVYLSYLLSGCLVCIFSLFHEEKLTSKFFYKAFKPFEYLLDIHYHVHNKENFENDRGYVIVANHQHGIDAAVSGKVMVLNDNLVRTVVKQEIRRMGPFGYGLAKAGTIFVNRASSEECKAVLNEAGARAMADKSSILIFPEGTRNNFTDGLLEFKKGAFHVAVDAGLPILPIVIGKYHFMDHRRKIAEPRWDIHLHVLPAIETQGLTKTDIPDLIEKTREVMEVKFKETLATRPKEETCQEPKKSN